MIPLRVLSPSEQVAEYLRRELLQRRWTETMPGVPHLAEELGIDRKTVDAALRQLDTEGILVLQGTGRRRRIARQPAATAPRPLRVAILDYDPLEMTAGYMVELQHLLSQAGHSAFFASKCLMELGMDVERIARLVKQTEADAWVVASGSRGVLEWFAAGPVPSFALFGRRQGLPIAAVGPNKPPAYAAVARRLIELGHRRLVLLVRSGRRFPDPGVPELAFLEEMESHGIAVGPYNLPDWKESIDGFHRALALLFDRTPPTALVVDELTFFIAAQQFLAQRGLKVPEDVSLICTDASPAFAWCRPPVSHIAWDSRPVVRRVLRWANKVNCGKKDSRQSLTKAEFVEGGTIGPVKAG